MAQAAQRSQAIVQSHTVSESGPCLSVRWEKVEDTPAGSPTIPFRSLPFRLTAQPLPDHEQK